MLNIQRIAAAGAVAAVGAAGIATLATQADASSPANPASYSAQVLRDRQGEIKAGTTVSARAIFGQRIFTSATYGYALAADNQGQFQYPAVTTNGGRTWKLAGPPFHIDAADAPESVTAIGTAGRKTLFAYGPSVIDVSSNGGRTWYETFPDQFVASVTVGANGYLVAYVQQGVRGAQTVQYVSKDGGKHWRLSTALDGGL